MTTSTNFFIDSVSLKLVNKLEEQITLDITDQMKTGAFHIVKNKNKPSKKSSSFILTPQNIYFVKKILNQTTKTISFISKAKIQIGWLYTQFTKEIIKPYSAPTYFINFRKNNKTFILSTNNKAEYSVWKNLISAWTIKTGFFDKYEVKGLIGEGSSAKVYKIIEKDTKQIFACKRIKKEAIRNDDIKKALMNEIEILRALKGHPNTIDLKEVFESENSIYIVTELCEGGRLIEKNKIYSFSDIIELAKALLTVMMHIKSKQIVHRDIKPSNILLKVGKSFVNNIKLIDFGLAMFENSDIVLFPYCGTLGYLPPEALKKGSVYHPNHFSDIYSIGIILYNALTGSRAFWDEDNKIMLRNNREGNLDYEEQLFKQAPIKRKIISSKFNYQFNEKRTN